MKGKELATAAGRGLRSLGLSARRYGPTGLFVAGVGVGIAAVVQAVKDTRNGGGEVLDRYDKVKTKLKKNLEDPDMKAYGEKEYKRDLRAAKKDCTIDCAKAYKKTGMKAAIAFALGTAGFVITKKQLRNTAAALGTMTATFAGYRANVVEDLGEEKDFEYLHNIKTRKVEKTELDPETGEEKKVEEEIKVVETSDDPGIDGYSRWARFYDDSCKEWTKDSAYNLAFLLARQEEANSRLKRDGYLFLNDVYEMLGIQKTYEGQIYGWRYLKNNPRGDNKVDFGIHNGYSVEARDFVNGYKNVILLDFNLDGDILNTFPRPKRRK